MSSLSAMVKVALMLEDKNYDLTKIQADLGSDIDVVWWDDCRSWEEDRLAAACREVDVVVTGRRSPRLPDALSDDLGQLRLLAHCHGTVKGLVSIEHLQAGLQVSNWGNQVYGVAEAALTMLLSCLKQLHQLSEFVKADWSNDQRIYQDFPATLVERDVGLYGFGPIGRHMGRILNALGANVWIYDIYADDLPDYVQQVHSLEDLFDTCQAVSIHCGLNDQTRGSITEDLLRRLPQGGILVNTARGPIVREADLAKVVEEGLIVAGVDVIENERQWAQSTLNQPNVIFGGHKASSGHPRPLPPEQKKKSLPAFVLHNCRALAAETELVNIIPVDVFAIKT